ncbi:MAG: hypothetical protein CMM58_04135 [Rhodospirillaceae bacterium]|nr:hypothetical protein [Rhodospirillaceae bacterium]|tara:strand:- start:642 stop:1262 length:621 start_codon:yes stop_codon:yes gene_type:complete
MIARKKIPGILCFFRKKFVFLVPLIFFLTSACNTTGPATAIPELTFNHRPLIALNVAKIKVINEYKMPFKGPNVEHRVPISPGASAERWAADILNPIGTDGFAQFVITSGSVIQEDLHIKTGLKGVFSIDQSKRFTANVKARLEIFDGGQRMGTVEAAASRSHTLREDASPNLKTRLWYNLVEKLMQTFDIEMRNQINTHLKKYRR